MSTALPGVIRWGAEQARTAVWRGQPAVACLSPLPDAPPPSTAFVRRCLDHLSAKGFSSVITSALAPGERAAFLQAGFTVYEELHLLAHDLRRVPPAATGAGLRRARAGDRPAVLAVDAAAFPPFWRIDAAGLDEAVRATARARFRVAEPDGLVEGYAVTGRSGRRGFVQRLAVSPGRQRRGIGRALVLDALGWLRRWRVDQAVVNTQVGNDAALVLYESVGFTREPDGLCVLRRDLDP